MRNKAVKIILDTVASVIVFIVMLVVMSEVLGWALGMTKDASGADKIRGGAIVTVIVFGLGAVVTVVFGIWFYKFLGRKSKAITANVGE